jgi:hypothetical protein
MGNQRFERNGGNLGDDFTRNGVEKLAYWEIADYYTKHNMEQI